MPRHPSIDPCRVRLTVATISWALAHVGFTAGAASQIDFQRDIQPVLSAHCVKCHGREKQKGGLRLDVKAAAFKGGDSGEAGIVPGHASQSRLFRMVTSMKEDVRMPPKEGPLEAKQIELLQRWIDAGAAWPDALSATPVARAEMKVTDADRQHWSYLPLQTVKPPRAKDAGWARTPVDHFIRHAQEAKGLKPSPRADSRTLVRRIYFDLIGLPPSPEEMTRWTARLEKDSKAVSALVDELLTSPHYGERWARHWLDVARYADSSGMESDHDRPNAYRFRDFVIRALNDDMAYDQFIRWQLAGDEIAPDKPDAIAATGFLAAGVNAALPDKLLEEERLRNRADELDDIVSTTGQAMLGLTLACARCHDHKYDPLPTRDYYRLMHVFNSGDRGEVPLVPPSEAKAHAAAMASWQKDFDTSVKERDTWLKQAREPVAERMRLERIAALNATDDEKQLLKSQPDSAEAKKLANRLKKELRIEDADYVAALGVEAQSKWRGLDARVRAVEKRKPGALPMTFGYADFGPEPKESWFFERGNFMARNEKMDLGFLTVMLRGSSAGEYWRSARESRRRDDSTQQRLALANWMTDLDHGAGSLLARVMVNRIWQHHFGEGLVRTVSDFGSRGEAPTHPELLDWLTGEFVRSGWSVKSLHRLIVNSASYLQGSGGVMEFRSDDEKPASTITPPLHHSAGPAVDPENRLLWHRRPIRLESEILRDSMLAVAGTLNPAMFGPGFKPPIVAEAMQARNVKSPYPRDAKDSPETRRRTVYMFHKRVVQYPLMQAFDAPDAQQSCGRRLNTTVAPQALALLDDPFVRARAEELANRLQKGGQDVRGQIQHAFQLCLNREPASEELAEAADFVTTQTNARLKRGGSKAESHRLAFADFCQSLFGLNEFIYVD